jgi:hypothetical protein
MSDSNQAFDITIKEGRENALAIVIASAILVRTGTFLVARGARHQKRPNQSVDRYKLLFPLQFWLGKVLFDGISSLTSGANEKEIAKQRKVAIDII